MWKTSPVVEFRRSKMWHDTNIVATMLGYVYYVRSLCRIVENRYSWNKHGSETSLVTFFCSNSESQSTNNNSLQNDTCYVRLYKVQKPRLADWWAFSTLPPTIYISLGSTHHRWFVAGTDRKLHVSEVQNHICTAEGKARSDEEFDLQP
jgi:hypothetical protein